MPRRWTTGGDGRYIKVRIDSDSHHRPRNCLVGIVTVDDAMFVLQDETTEDISIMAGVSPNEDSYFGTSVFRHAKNRVSG